MDRRSFIIVGAAGVTGALIPHIIGESCTLMPVESGWIFDLKAIKRFTHHIGIKTIAQKTSDTFIGSGKGGRVLLYKYLEKELGKIIPHDQEIGDCIGQSYGLAIDILAATQIHGLGLAEKFTVKSSIEAIYAGSRYEIGYLKHRNSRLLYVDGSWGVWAAQFLNQYGVLPRGIYGDIDLTEYDWEIARLWGKRGIPDDLEPQIKKHPIRSYAQVGSYENVRDAIVNGYPVVMSSSYGFNPRCRSHNRNGRDKMGFLNRCGTWYHSMTAIGVDDTKRPGILLANSWGKNWVSGGTRFGQPEGSFWVDANTIDSMASQGDSYAISGYMGFPMATLDYTLF